MKKLIFLLVGLAFTGLHLNALENSYNSLTTTAINGYGNSIIFTEGGIEFSVFPDGQFDFYIQNYGPNVNVSVGSPKFSFSFNSGYDYNPYVQYDEFGAIIQIENIPIYYDYYGRIIQAGNVNINYNNYGYVTRVGGLHVYYDNYNRFFRFSGFINIYNRHYVYRPWHRYYSVPAYNYCVVYNRPYRQYYEPVRYVYTRPFYNNYRPRTAVASRRGEMIVRNSSYATVNRSSKNITQINKSARSDYSDSRNSQIAKRDYSTNRGSHDERRNYISREDNSSRYSQPKSPSQTRESNRYSDNRDYSHRESTKKTQGNFSNNNASRNSNLDLNRNYSDSKKPNSSGSRIYNENNVTKNAPQVNSRQSGNNERSFKQAPQSTRQTQSTPTITQSRGYSTNDKSQSASRRRL